MQKSAKVLGFTILILLALTIGAWYVVFAEEKKGEMRVSFLDVGQGDSIFIEAPSGRQVLIDGGPDRSVLRELGKIMPWWDRSIDVVIATHPDADHVVGLVDVLQRYTVDFIFDPGVKGDTPQAESMLASVARENAEHILARRGHVIDLGEGARLEILFPDRDVSDLETNTASIVARLVYGETSFVLTGDSPESIEKYLVGLDGDKLAADVLKAGHHGSRTSSSLSFVGFVGPHYGIFSRGCDNSYGHPHQEVRDVFARLGVEALDTCEEGTITFVSNGSMVQRK
jgi:competence protein ComEC